MNLKSALIRRVIAPAWAAREGSAYLRTAADLERRERISPDQRKEEQWEKLRSILDYASRTSPFYQRRFQALGFEPREICDPADLSRLPILTKKDLQDSSDQIRSRLAKPVQTTLRRTSGSTGTPVQVLVDECSLQWKRGVTLYRDQWTGWRLGQLRGMLWGNPSHLSTWRGRLRNALLERCLYLDTLRMTDRSLRDFARLLLTTRPVLLFGHAHSLYLLARFWKDKALATYQPRAVLTTAMVLHAHERRVIEEVFACPVFDRYGCEEVSLIASECEAHEGLHINSDSLYVEVVDEQGPVRAGCPGKVLLTDLTNRAMPIIRYEVGDVGILSDSACSCGRTYPLLTSVAGRVADYLLTPDGELVSGISLTENFANLIPGMRQIQIVQDRADHLTIRLVAASGPSEEQRHRIAELVSLRFGPRMSFAVRTVDQILPEPSGKYRFAIRAFDALT